MLALNACLPPHICGVMYKGNILGERGNAGCRQARALQCKRMRAVFAPVVQLQSRLSVAADEHQGRKHALEDLHGRHPLQVIPVAPLLCTVFRHPAHKSRHALLACRVRHEAPSVDDEVAGHALAHKEGSRMKVLLSRAHDLRSNLRPAVARTAVWQHVQAQGPELRSTHASGEVQARSRERGKARNTLGAEARAEESCRALRRALQLRKQERRALPCTTLPLPHGDPRGEGVTRLHPCIQGGKSRGNGRAVSQGKRRRNVAAGGDAGERWKLRGSGAASSSARVRQRFPGLLKGPSLASSPLGLGNGTQESTRLLLRLVRGALSTRARARGQAARHLRVLPQAARAHGAPRNPAAPQHSTNTNGNLNKDLGCKRNLGLQEVAKVVVRGSPRFASRRAIIIFSNKMDGLCQWHCWPAGWPGRRPAVGVPIFS